MRGMHLDWIFLFIYVDVVCFIAINELIFLLLL